MSWESCSDYPSQFHLTAVAAALRVKISSIIDKDIDAMMAAIHVAETRETLCMATLTALALVCTAGLVATSQLSPDSVPVAANVVKALAARHFLGTLWLLEGVRLLLGQRHIERRLKRQTALIRPLC